MAVSNNAGDVFCRAELLLFAEPVLLDADVPCRAEALGYRFGAEMSVRARQRPVNTKRGFEMRRLFLNATIAFALLATGWVVAKAQTPAPSFELVVDAPSGATTIRCVRGCALMWVERGINANARPTNSFNYACTGARCSSGRIGGWITR
jgi:hypothetical protein